MLRVPDTTLAKSWRDLTNVEPVSQMCISGRNLRTWVMVISEQIKQSYIQYVGYEYMFTTGGGAGVIR